MRPSVVFGGTFSSSIALATLSLASQQRPDDATMLLAVGVLMIVTITAILFLVERRSRGPGE